MTRFGGPPDHPATATGPARTSLAVVRYPAPGAGRRPTRPGGGAPRRRGVAGRGLGRPGDAGARRGRHPGAAGRRGRPVGVPATRPARAPGCCWASATGACGSRSSSTPSYADGEGWVGLRDLLPHLAGDAVEQAPLVFHAIGLAEWLFATRLLPALRRPARAAAGRARAGVRRVPPAAVPAHRPGRDHGDHARRAGLAGRGAAARPAGRLAVRALLDPGRASWSRARRSRTPYAVRSPRRPASSSAR